LKKTRKKIKLTAKIKNSPVKTGRKNRGRGRGQDALADPTWGKKGRFNLSSGVGKGRRYLTIVLRVRGTLYVLVRSQKKARRKSSCGNWFETSLASSSPDRNWPKRGGMDPSGGI